MGGALLDGVVRPDDGKKRKITLELTTVTGTILSAGSEFEADVRLVNSDTNTISIPWSADPAVAKAGPDADHTQYEIGDLDLNLVDSSGSTFELKTLSGGLFGSKYVTGTLLEIAPAEWVAVRIRVKLTTKYFGLPKLTEGKAQLRADWTQDQHAESLNRGTCEAWGSTFLYRDYYDQKSEAAAITIK